jgi:hypothetical protein
MIFQLAKTIAQHADEPQECNAGERHQVYRQSNSAGTGVQPGARFLRIGRN